MWGRDIPQPPCGLRVRDMQQRGRLESSILHTKVGSSAVVTQPAAWPPGKQANRAESLRRVRRTSFAESQPRHAVGSQEGQGGHSQHVYAWVVLSRAQVPSQHSPPQNPNAPFAPAGQKCSHVRLARACASKHMAGFTHGRPTFLMLRPTTAATLRIELGMPRQNSSNPSAGKKRMGRW